MFVSRLSELLARLPLYAEEGYVVERIPESDLIDAAGEITVGFVRRLLQALSLLDEQALQDNNWSFVSFPASLTARSILETLAHPQGAFLPQDYWQQGAHRPKAVLEEQRTLLQRLEQQRAKTGQPIRFVSVAWGLVRAGDKLLLCPREDIRRRNAGNYVLPGGRLSANDLPSTLRTPEVLARLHAGDTALLEQTLPLTLSRELEEELALQEGEDYQAHWLEMLPPYEQCEGAGNHFAFSRYYIALYSVSLTRRGLLKLLDLEASTGAEKMAWFTHAELQAGRRHDGLTCFVKALFSEGSRFASNGILAVPEAFSDTNTSITGVEWPASPDDTGSIGPTGKEKPLLLQLSSQAWALGLLLIWHKRGFQVQWADDAIAQLGFGWLKLANKSLLAVAHELVLSCSKAALGLFEIEEDCYVRCAAASEVLWFSPSWFAQELAGEAETDDTLTIKLNPPELPWGELLPVTAKVPMRHSARRIVVALANGEDPREIPGVSPVDLKSKLKQKFDTTTRALGLRKYVRGLGNDETGTPRLTISPPKHP